MQQLPKEFVQHKHVDRKHFVMFNFYGKYIKLSDSKNSKIQYLDYSLSFDRYDNSSISATTSLTEHQSCFYFFDTIKAFPLNVLYTVQLFTWWLVLNYNLMTDSSCVLMKGHMRIRYSNHSCLKQLIAFRFNTFHYLGQPKYCEMPYLS